METKTAELEVVADPKLAKYAGETGLEKQSTETLVEAFKPIFAKARAAIDAAKGVAESVKDATCVTEIKKSRACRLALRAVRLESDGVRKKQKEHALLYGRAVDGFHNILLADLTPVETALQEAEDVAERAEAARKATLKAEREKELAPLLDTPVMGDLSALSEAEYKTMLNDAKLLRQAKIDAAAKAEADRKAKEEADRLERERIAAENEKLKAAAAETARLAEIERKRIEAEREAERAKATAEAERAAKAAKIEREKALAAAKVESDRLASELEAKAKADAAENAKKQAKLEADRKKAEAARKEAEAEAAKVRAEMEAKATAEAKVRQAAELAAKEAAAAPDKAKLEAFAAAIRALVVPTIGNEAVGASLTEQTEKFAAWVESCIKKL